MSSRRPGPVTKFELPFDDIARAAASVEGVGVGPGVIVVRLR